MNSQAITGSLPEEVVRITKLVVSPGTPPSSARAPCVLYSLRPFAPQHHNVLYKLEFLLVYFDDFIASWTPSVTHGT